MTREAEPREENLRPRDLLDRDFFLQSPVECARGLIGSLLVWGNRVGRIVETEAYAAEGDSACHTAKRPSARRFIESHPAGSAYVYFNYGMHWMLNALTKGEEAGFVLFRALEPLRGLAAMSTARGARKVEELCSGPGKLAAALGVTGEDHGRDLCRGRKIRLEAAREGENLRVLNGPRVGISSAKELPWRFCLAGSPHVSRPRLE